MSSSNEPVCTGPALLASSSEGEVLWAQQVQAPAQLGQLMATLANALSQCGARAGLSPLERVSLTSRQFVTCLASSGGCIAATHRWERSGATQAALAVQDIQAWQSSCRPTDPGLAPPDSNAPVDKAGAVDPMLPLLEAVARGDLAEAEQRLANLRAAHEKQEPFIEGSTIAAQSVDSLQLLVDAVRLVASDNVTPGLRTLVRLSADERCSQQVQWTARLWAARGAVRRGEASRALIIARDAHERAQRLGSSAQLVSDGALAEALALAGSAEVALPMAREVQARVHEVADSATLARACLLEAVILSRNNQLDEALAAALVARRANPMDPEASLVMARLTLLKGQPANLEELLHNTSCIEASWLLSLSHQLRLEALTFQDVCLLLDILVQPSTAQGLERLCELSKRPPLAAAALELLAIRLLRLGRYSECQSICTKLSGYRCRQQAAQAIGRQLPADGDHERRPSSVAPLPSLPPGSDSPQPSGDRSDPGDTIFSGDLGQLALAEVLEFLRAGRRSGTLYCRSSETTGILVLRAGRLASAQYLSNFQQTETRPAVGAISHDTHAAAALSLGDLERQAISVVRQLISWTEGQFGFEPLISSAGATSSQDSPSVDCQFVLLEVYRKLDEDSSAEERGEAVGS